jgi:hypothetical protein
MKKLPFAVPGGAIAGLILACGLPAGAQSLVLQLDAANYNPTTGVWTDTSGTGDNATYGKVGGTGGAEVLPTLVNGATPNGSPAVDITAGNGSFLLSSSLAASSGYTIFAFVAPAVVSGGSRYALTGGSSPGALEYNFYQGQQNYLEEYVGGGGAGTATIPTTSFSLVDLAVSSAGGSFRLNGSPDGTATGASTFTSPITRIGNNEGGGDGLVGEISEIDIFSGVMNPTQIANEEALLTSEYVTSVPEPSTWLMLASGLGTLVAVRRFRRPQA